MTEDKTDNGLFNILIAEDNESIRLILRKSLENEGFHVQDVTDGDKVLSTLDEFSPDLILLDIEMPELDGFKVCEKLKSCEETKNIPIIFLTGLNDTASIRQGFKIGGADYVTKPYQKAELLARVRTHLHLVHTQKMLKEEIAKLKKTEKELKEKQKMLIHSEKMASIGQLAAGIAHEINNPIGFIMSNIGTMTEYSKIFKQIVVKQNRLEIAFKQHNTAEQQRIFAELKDLKEQEDLAFILEDIDSLLDESLKGTERVRDIVRNLKSFARMDESATFRLGDINAGIENILKVIWNELKYNCDVETDLKPLPLVGCLIDQLQQVFMNLLINASHAMTERGKIRIESEVVGESIIIRFIDNGQGIPPEHLSKIFDPFFTSKDVGKGTGLGLSISQGIIEKHQGTISVESEVGKGSTFTIELPITRRANNGE